MADDAGTVQDLPVPPAETNRGLRMTEGPVGRLLFQLTVPLAWGILAVLGYRLAEAWFVGALGPGALAAISFAFPRPKPTVAYG